MKYTIDGYNLFFYVETEINPLEKKREAFIDSLNQLLERLNLHATLIFDSSKEHAVFFPSKRVLTALEIIFSPEGTSADEYILEYLSISKNPQTHIVVTSDRELAFKAKQLRCKTQSIEVFFEMLAKRKKGLKREEKKQETETTHDFNRLLEAFENKLRNE